MQRTPNLGLPQFEPSDKYRLEDYNEAYMKIDEKIKELKDKEAQLDTKLAEAQSIIDTWTQFKATGGEIGGNIVRVNHEKQYDWTFGHSGFTDKSAMVSLKDRVTQATIGLNFNLKPGVSSSISPISNGEMDFGLPNYTFKDIYLNGVSKNTNGYTKLPNGIIMQWGSIRTALTSDGQNVTGTITLPIQFPNACRFAEGRPTFVDGGSYKASLYNGAITVINNSTLQMYFMRHTNGPTISEPVDVNWIAIGY